MDTKKKYRLGNQSEEYELKTDYIGWLPKDTNDWLEFLHPSSYVTFDATGKEVTIVSPDNKEKVTLMLHQEITKDAFPMSFYGEKTAENWNHFCIVATNMHPLTKFIIPLH
jgi:hypothetical protein